MKPEDKDKLDECLRILDTTDLGLSMVWLWTWSTIGNILDDEQWEAKLAIDEMWGHLCDAVAAGESFSLDSGPEKHYNDILKWMLEKGFIEERVDEDEN